MGIRYIIRVRGRWGRSLMEGIRVVDIGRMGIRCQDGIICKKNLFFRRIKYFDQFLYIIIFI